MSEYVGININADPEQQEILLALLSDFSFESFQENEGHLSAYMTTTEWNNEQKSILSFLKDRSLDYHLEQFADKNWNEEWEKNFQPIKIEDKVHVRADFHPRDEKAKIDLVITPQMSFGTGHHQTTYLMMEAILSMGFTGKRVLDMGCGTGILGILASKMGAAEILAVDIESWAVENSKENIARNGVDNMQVIQADIDLLNQKEHFEVILANINRNVLLRHLPHYSEMLEQSGNLLLSGILKEDLKLMKEEVEALGLTIVNTRTKENWAMIHAIKK